MSLQGFRSKRTDEYTRLAIDQSVKLLSKYKLEPNVLNFCRVLLNGLYSMECQ